MATKRQTAREMRQGRRTPQEAGEILAYIAEMVAQGKTPEEAVAACVDAGIVPETEAKAALAAYIAKAGKTPVPVATPSPTMNPVRGRLLEAGQASPTPEVYGSVTGFTRQPIGGPGGVVPGGAAGTPTEGDDVDVAVNAAAELADRMKVPGMGRGYFMTMLLYHNSTPEEAFLATQEWLNEQAALKKSPAKPPPEPKWGGTNMTLTQINQLADSSGADVAAMAVAKDLGLSATQLREFMKAKPTWQKSIAAASYGVSPPEERAISRNPRVTEANPNLVPFRIGNAGYALPVGVQPSGLPQPVVAPNVVGRPAGVAGMVNPPQPKQYSDMGVAQALAQAIAARRAESGYPGQVTTASNPQDPGRSWFGIQSATVPEQQAGIHYGNPQALANFTSGGGGGGGGGAMTAYQKAQMELDWAQLAQQKALQEAQLAAQRRQVAMQIGEALAQQASQNWQRGMPYMLPKEMNYAPGFEAGGSMQALANLGGYTYNPQQIGPAPSPSLEELQGYINKALARWG